MSKEITRIEILYRENDGSRYLIPTDGPKDHGQGLATGLYRSGVAFISPDSTPPRVFTEAEFRAVEKERDELDHALSVTLEQMNVILRAVAKKIGEMGADMRPDFSQLEQIAQLPHFASKARAIAQDMLNDSPPSNE